MPRKGMSSLCFHQSKTSSFSLSSPASARSLMSDAASDHIIESAAALILKWDPDSSAYAKVTSLFYESKQEAHSFMRRVNDLQRLMHFLVADADSSSSDKLVAAQTLMQIAMKRLQKEFYQILSTNRAYLDPESVSSRASTSDADESDDLDQPDQVSSSAMDDLRSIAECMISAGYAKECIEIYNIIRKSIVDEGIYRLGVEKLTAASKLDWKLVDLRINTWLHALKVSLGTLFNGERILCDHVFSASDSVRESCFSHISRDGALLLFGFPEAIVSKAMTRKSAPPEKVFRALDMYTAIYHTWPEIDSIFAFDSSAAVRDQAYSSLLKIADFVRAALAEFEASIHKDSSKPSTVRGGGLHRLTVRATAHLTLLADYANALSDILRDSPPPAASSPQPSFYDDAESEDEEEEESSSSWSSASAVSARMSWLLLVVLCKLDGKAKRYDDASMSYLFLANNLQHVVSQARGSSLQDVLGEDWCDRHERKVRQFAANYERLGWGKAICALPAEDPSAEISAEEAKTILRSFNASFEEAMKKQRSSAVPDPKLRDHIKQSLRKKLVRVYREFYNANNHNIPRAKYTPDDVDNYLSDLFYGTTAFEDEIKTLSSSSASSASSSPSSSARRRHWRLR